jgi:hypothetical protein
MKLVFLGLLLSLLSAHAILSKELLDFYTNDQLVELILRSQSESQTMHEPQASQPVENLDSKEQVSSGSPLIWPHPAMFNSGATSIGVDFRRFQLLSTTPCSDLSAAFNRYLATIFPHSPKSPQPPESEILPSLIVTVADISGELQLETDESYNLTIPSNGEPAMLFAKTLAGAYNGLETFSQLVLFNFSSKSYFVASTPWTISDFPRFKHREVQICSPLYFQ